MSKISRRILLGAGAAALAGGARADYLGGNPYFLFEAEENPCYSDPAGKILRTATLDPSKRNCILVIAGQSNFQNIAPTLVTPVNATMVDQISLYDGNVYAAADPLLNMRLAPPRDRLGCPATRLADSLVSAGKFDRVILLPIALGNTSVADWLPGGVAGTRIQAAGYRLAKLRMTATAVLWGQGENDTALGTTAVAYAQALLQVIANFRASGMACPFLVAQQSYNIVGGVAVTSSAVTMAQADVVNSANGIFSGPNADSLTDINRNGGGVHWSDAGSAAYANLWQNALIAAGPPFA